MMETIRLSVVVPAYNVEDFVGAAVRSVLEQAYKNLEVIVVDDGSTDRTAQKVREIRDPRVSLVTQSNAGLSAARNSGIRVARGEYIALLDGDDLWFPNYVQKHLEMLDANPAVGIGFNNLAYIDEKGRLTGQLLITNVPSPGRDQLIARNSITSHAVVRRRCFECVGLFDEDLSACEDQEMWIRIVSRTQFTAKLIPAVLSAYRMRAGSLTMSFEAQIRNTAKLMDKLESEPAGLSNRQRRRAMAEANRIVSRKALATCQFHSAEKYCAAALRMCPLLFMRDLRAVGLLVLIGMQKALPARCKTAPYWTATSVVSLVYRLMFKRFYLNTCIPSVLEK